MSIDTHLAAALVRLTLDLSGGDPALMEKTQAIIADPPTTLEEVGFYGAEDFPADERALRAVLFRLSQAGHILGFEDKYVSEMIGALIQNGLVPENHGSEALTTFTIDGDMDELVSDDDPVEAAERMAAQLPAATRALEAAVASKGQQILYVDLPVGDTLHYIFVSPEVAKTWKDVILYRTDDGPIAITGPQWMHFWEFLIESADLEDDAPEPDLPPYPVENLRSLKDAGF